MWLSAQIGAFCETELELGYVSEISIPLTYLPGFHQGPSGSFCHYLHLPSSVLPEYFDEDTLPGNNCIQTPESHLKVLGTDRDKPHQAFDSTQSALVIY